MKKLTAIMLVVFMLTFMLTGCVRDTIDIKLSKNGTGTVSATVALRKDIVTQTSQYGAEDPFFGKETFETEYDGDKYIAYTETKEYSSFEELEKALLEMTYNTDLFGETELPVNEGNESDTDTEYVTTLPYSETGSGHETVTSVSEQETDAHIFKSVKITKDGAKYVFDAVLNSYGEEIYGYDMSDVLKLSISVEMPASITSYKNGIVEKNRITFDVKDMSKETEMYAECKVISPIPAIIGIGLAVASTVVFFVLRKKK